MKTNYHKEAIDIIANHKEMNKDLIIQIAKDRPSAVVNAFNVLVPTEWIAEVKKLLPENKIQAIKLCRELTGWGLMEAKKAVEGIKY